ncbi:COPII coat assembly protein, Sec16 [Artemisia annua]|uniref:COPII coat assembly protein, Sec16 n=1 Tax=Artemisia annua TaxID=35608 RepID=A0A2U1KW74_ARTAN|nr:COPII coat assembly protein, Sec16 [Artemisia annua]
MLDNWEENLAMITANRTKDDELVLIHLGDCLWKETSNPTFATYLLKQTLRLIQTVLDCLIGADHWKHPRTYASLEAIQRTELYEYSKLLGNSQFTLLPFQPYKLIYASMLAEVGRVSDSLKVGSTNLAPGKLVGKLLNLFDSTAHRVVGGLPPPVPSISSSSAQNEHNDQPTGPQT